MLSFKTRQDAYEYCLESLENLKEQKSIYLNIGNVPILELCDISKKIHGHIIQYSDVAIAIKAVEKLNFKNKDKITMVLDELLMNALKGNGQYKTIDEIEKIRLDENSKIRYEINDYNDEKTIELKVIDNNGEITFDKVVHALSEEVVKPRLSGKFGGGFGLRVVTLYTTKLAFNINPKQNSEVIVSIPYRNKEFNNFQLIFRSNHVK